MQIDKNRPSFLNFRALTIRWPDDKHIRLCALASSRVTTINRLIDEMATLMLAEFDVETWFCMQASAGAGKTARGLELLKKAMG